MAALVLTPVSGLWLALPIAALALVLLVLKARPITRGNVALLVLLLHLAWQNGAPSVAFTLNEARPDVAEAAAVAAIPAQLLWAPVVFLVGPLLLGNAPRAKRLVLLASACALPGLALTGAFLAAPELVLAAGGLTEAAAAGLFLVFLGFAFTVAVLAREAFATKLPVRRAHLALLAAAFSVEGAYHAAQNAAKIGLGLEFHGIDAPGLPLVALSLASLVAFLGVAAWALRVALASKEPDTKRWARRLVGFIAAAAATGVAASPLTTGNEFTDPVGAFHALWDFLALGLIVYAGLRFQLFNLERRAQQSVAVTAALAMAFLSFGVLSELLEGVLQDVTFIGGLPSANIVSAAVVGVIGIPIVQASKTLSKRLFPKVADDAAYEKHRKLLIYRAALEAALADGVQTPKEHATLARLRQDLGIGDEEHASLEGEARRRLGGPVAFQRVARPGQA